MSDTVTITLDREEIMAILATRRGDVALMSVQDRLRAALEAPDQPQVPSGPGKVSLEALNSARMAWESDRDGLGWDQVRDRLPNMVPTQQVPSAPLGDEERERLATAEKFLIQITRYPREVHPGRPAVDYGFVNKETHDAVTAFLTVDRKLAEHPSSYQRQHVQYVSVELPVRSLKALLVPPMRSVIAGSGTADELNAFDDAKAELWPLLLAALTEKPSGDQEGDGR